MLAVIFIAWNFHLDDGEYRLLVWACITFFAQFPLLGRRQCLCLCSENLPSVSPNVTTEKVESIWLLNGFALG